jgi:hypothetical protein
MRMLSALASFAWKKLPPLRGGVTQQWVFDQGKGSRLELEERGDHYWLWMVSRENKHCLQLKPNSVPAMVDVMAVHAKQMDNSLKATEMLCAVGDVSVLRWEQFMRPFENELLLPGDTTCKGLKDIAEFLLGNPDKAGGKFNISVSHPESPSVMMAFRVATAALTPTDINVEIKRIQQPDPREPKGKVEFVLWKYKGTKASPAVKAPDERLLRLLTPLASLPFNIEEWDDQAARIAARLGPEWASHLAASMVHPMAPSPGFDAFDWVQRFQIAAALVLSYIDQGWQGSRRESMLRSIAFGPMDWTNSAAILALGRIALREPQLQPEIENLFKALLQKVGQSGYTSFEYPLACVWLTLPQKSEAFVKELERWRDRAIHGAPDTDENTDGSVPYVDAEGATLAHQDVQAGKAGEKDFRSLAPDVRTG